MQQLLNILDAKDSVLAEGDSRQVKLSLVVLLEVEAICVEDVNFVPAHARIVSQTGVLCHNKIAAYIELLTTAEETAPHFSRIASAGVRWRG